MLLRNNAQTEIKSVLYASPHCIKIAVRDMSLAMTGKDDIKKSTLHQCAQWCKWCTHGVPSVSIMCASIPKQLTAVVCPPWFPSMTQLSCTVKWPFVHYAGALCTVPTVRDTIKVVTGKCIITRDALYQRAMVPINTLCTPLHITFLTENQLISLLCALDVHSVTQLRCPVPWICRRMLYYRHSTWNECIRDGTRPN